MREWFAVYTENNSGQNLESRICDSKTCDGAVMNEEFWMVDWSLIHAQCPCPIFLLRSADKRP